MSQPDPQKMLLMHGRYIPVKGGQTPLRATIGSTGFDCFANLFNADYPSSAMFPIEIAPGKWQVIPLGFRLEVTKQAVVPINWAGADEVASDMDLDHTNVYQFELRSRSGLAAKHGITVLNAPGTIDADYTDEVRVILLNQGPDSFFVHHGDRVCQAVWPHYMPWAALPDGLRCLGADRAGGFGSTGAR
jgi:deoxyuridine 5'-triphosphate nucleotidohydrolase